MLLSRIAALFLVVVCCATGCQSVHKHETLVHCHLTLNSSQKHQANDQGKDSRQISTSLPERQKGGDGEQPKSDFWPRAGRLAKETTLVFAKELILVLIEDQMKKNQHRQDFNDQLDDAMLRTSSEMVNRLTRRLLTDGQ